MCQLCVQKSFPLLSFLLASSMTTVFPSPHNHSSQTLAAFFHCSLPVLSNTKKVCCLKTALSSIKGSYNNGTKGRESLPSQNLLYCHIKYRYIWTLLQVKIPDKRPCAHSSGMQGLEEQPYQVLPPGVCSGTETLFRTNTYMYRTTTCTRQQLNSNE